RRVLQAAAEADVEPASLYRRAIAIYEALDSKRRSEHPEWGSWPAPPFEAVEPATWPHLEREARLSIHGGRLIRVLSDRGDPQQRLERLRFILTRAEARGADPAEVYRWAIEVYSRLGGGDDRSPAPAYEAVRPKS